MATPNQFARARETATVIPSLFDDYNAGLVGAGLQPVELVDKTEGELRGINLYRATEIAKLFGKLTQSRMRTTLDEPVIVARFEVERSEATNETAIARRAVLETHDYLGISWIRHTNLITHAMQDETGHETQIREVELPGGWFVSSHIGTAVCKVVLSAESALPATS